MNAVGWERPRRVAVLVDNDSWILPYAERLVREVGQAGDAAQLVRRARERPAQGAGILPHDLANPPGGERDSGLSVRSRHGMKLPRRSSANT